MDGTQARAWYRGWDKANLAPEADAQSEALIIRNLRTGEERSMPLPPKNDPLSPRERAQLNSLKRRNANGEALDDDEMSLMLDLDRKAKASAADADQQRSKEKERLSAGAQAIQQAEKRGIEVSAGRSSTKDELLASGQNFTAVATRKTPFKTERGFGESAMAAQLDAIRRVEGNKTESTAPEHAAVGVDDRELAQIVGEFNAAQESMQTGDEQITHVFDPPAKNEIVRLGDKVKVYNQQYGWMTPAEAKAKIAEWKKHAQDQGGRSSPNRDKVVLSLFDLSGEWSKPWEEAGYQVYRFDIQDDPEVGDVNNFSTDFFGDWFGEFDGQDIYAILAACPCTDFAVSGARHFAAKDADGRTVASVKLVHQTLATIEYFKPAVWAIENPVGRIEKLGGLPPWRLSFDPNHLGETYTKKTLLWGRFNGDLPIAPVEPTEGSKMHTQYGGKSLATKNARSVTPEGFAYSFFMANNAVDHPAMAIANKYDRLDRKLIERAVAAGVTSEQIDRAVEDFYYQDLDDDGANAAIRDLIPSAPTPAQQPPTSAPQSEAEQSRQVWQEMFDEAGVRMRDKLDAVDPNALRPMLEAMAERGIAKPDGDLIDMINPHRAVELGYIEINVDERGNRKGVITQAGRDFVSGKPAPTTGANQRPLSDIERQGMEILALNGNKEASRVLDRGYVKTNSQSEMSLVASAATVATTPPTKAGLSSLARQYPSAGNFAMVANRIYGIPDAQGRALWQEAHNPPPRDGGAAAEASAKPTDYGANNRLVTREQADEIRRKLREKLNPGRLNSGVDPEILALGTQLAVFHIEAGARRFADFARAVADDLGMNLSDLRANLRGWYNGARDTMEDMGESVVGMDGPEEVARAMRTFDQWANAPAMTEGANDATGAVDAQLPNRVPASDAGSGPGDVQSASPDGRDGSAPRQEASGGGSAVPPADQGRADAPERGAGKSASGARSDRAGVRNADNLPAAERDAGSAGKAAAAVKGTDWTIEPGSLAEERSAAQKARDNIDAIALVKQIEREGRSATREEQAQIARYVGWGGLKNVFPDPVTGQYGKGFETLGPRLRELLTDEEYETAARSIQYAHYTSESVVRPMWEIARQLGFTGGNVFEPGMGTGNFRGMMPADIAAASRYSGIEYDHLTASIAKLLYPQSGVQQADFTAMPGMKDAMDLVIGNPPFSETIVSGDPEYAKHKLVLHDYFFAKSLDALRPGGLLMFITSAGTMNKLGENGRAYLAERADLVGAIRLPGNAFEQNAGTSVTTDIVILRKRKAGEAPGDRSWIGTDRMMLPDRDGNMVEAAVNAYFTKNPEMILGEQGMFDKLIAGPRYAVRAPKGFDVASAIRTAAERLPGDILNTTPADMPSGFLGPDLDFGSGERKNGSYYIGTDGRLMQFRNGVGSPVQGRGKGVEGGMAAAAQERVRALVPIKDALRQVYAADIKNDAESGAQAREKLNKTYDAFVAKYGPINKTEVSYRRPSRVEMEGLRAAAREEARLAGTEWDDGSFDVQSMLDAGAKMAEIAAAREQARDAAKAAGRIWNEGSFDPEEVPDKVIEKRPNLDPFMDDDEAYRLAAIEHYNKDTGEATKGRAFFGNAITLESKPTINSANDALLFSLNRFGRPDLPTIARMAGKSESAVLEELSDRLFAVPGQPGVYETGETYLSGNVREKLAIARKQAEIDPDYTRNVRALEAAQPTPLTPSEISANLGMPWIPTDVIERFATEHMGLQRATVRYFGKLAQWETSGDTYSSAARSTWGTDRMDALALLTAALNRQTIIIKDTINTAEGKKEVVNEVATQAAQDKAAEIKQAFRDWVWTDEQRAGALVDLYNREYNSLVAPKYDGTYLTTPGIASGWSWRPHQRAVIARIIQSGNTYMAHEVGAGKTSAMIGSGMEMKRLGLVNKPMYVVPNHMLGQFTKEFYEQYPLARILVADEQRFHTSRRKEFVARMASEDWDAIIITHSAFGFIPMSQEFEERMLKAHLADIEDMISQIGKGQDVRVTRRKAQQQKEQAEQRLRALTSRKRDQVFTFEETGVDFLFVDEAHLFRKLDYTTKMGDIKGIDPKGSGMSFDLFAKTRYLEQRKPGRNLVLASGTPITNTMAELYSVSRYLQQNELEKRGLAHFDAWAGAFGDVNTTLEQDPAGGYKPVTRFSKFVNVPELSVMVRQVMDVVGAAELRQYVSLPKLKGGARQLIGVDQTEGQAGYQQTLKGRMEAIKARKGPPQKGDDIILSVINDGRKAAIDYRLIDATAPKDPGSKLERMIAEVAQRHKEFARTPFHQPLPGGAGFSEKPVTYGPATQMIFSDFGINGEFPVHKYIRNALIARGVPAKEIALIQDYKTAVAKQRLFNDMNEGKVRVLIGSVAKMGTGVNAQKRLRALHNMDAQWYPANDTQRNGRIIRQGNMNPEIEILDYATNGTYDSTMWGMMARKAGFIEGFMRGDPNMRDMEDLGEASQYEQAAAMTTSDPRIMDLTEWKQELEKVERRKMAFEREQHSIKRRIAMAQNDVEEYDRLRPLIEQDIANRKLPEGDEFTGTVDAQTYDDATEFGNALMGAMDAVVERANGRQARQGVGEYAGFQIVVENYPGPDGGNQSFLIKRAGDRETRIEMGTDARGLVTRMTNALKKFDTELESNMRRRAAAEAEVADFTPKLGGTFNDGGKIAELRGKINALEATLKAETEAIEKAKAEARSAAQNNQVRESVPEFDGEAAPVDRAAVADALRTQLAALRLADKVKVRVVETLGGAAGSYDNGIVTIATDTAQGAAFTLNHEAIHALRDMGVFKNEEWAILSATARRDPMLMRSIRQRYGKLSPEAQIEEAVADMFARHQDGRYEAGGTVQRVFKMLRQFFEAVRNAFAGRGLRSAEGVMQSIARGDVGARAGLIENRGEVSNGSAPKASEQEQFVAEWLTQMADADEMFQYPTSAGTTPKEVMADLVPSARQVIAANASDAEGSDTKDALREAGADRMTVFELSSGHRFTVYERGQSVWMDVSRLREGERGSAIYQAVADLAYNTGRKFIGDPAGLSDAALRRRTDAMLSSAIKHGTTDHLEPHPYQRTGNAELGVPPLKWREGDTLGNIQAMAETSLASLIHDVPEVANASFDTRTRTFRGGEGQPLSDEQLRTWGAAEGGRAQRAGRATVKRGILLNTLVRAESGARPGLLAQVLDERHQRLLGRGLADTFYSIPERADMVAAAADGPTWREKAGDAFDKWRTTIQDRYLPLLKVQREIEKQTGKSLPISLNPYMGEELMTGRIGARLEGLADDHVQPLFDAMHADKVTVEALESYLYARHAPERNARMQEINPELGPGEGSGMTDLEAAAIMSRIRRDGKMDVMERLAARVDAIINLSLDYRVETGLMSRAQADEWRSTYDYYVPLRGFKETGGEALPARPNRSGGGINVRGPESRAAYGRRSEADSPLAYIIMQAEEAIIRGETNRVAQRFINLARANPDPDFWKVNKTTAKRRMNEDSGLVESYLTHNLLAEDKDWTVSAKFDGKEVRVTMNKDNAAARRLADAMRNLTQHQMDWISMHLGKVNRFLSAVNTSYNPEFIIVNAIRDAMSAAINLAADTTTAILSGTFRDYRAALVASTKGAFGKTDGEWGKWYDEFLSNGGRVYFNKVENIDEIKQRIAKAAERATMRAGDGGGLLQTKRMLFAARDLIENVNLGVENAVRLAAYKNAREAGMSPDQAASLAKNVTVNFNRRGTAGPLINSLYLFANASVQGTARIMVSMRSPRVRKILAATMIGAAALEILNAMVSAIDDDGESIYDKIPAYEKSRNLIIMMPDGRTPIKLPLPYGYNVFYSAGRSAAEIARRGGDRWLETMGHFAGDAADAFNPIGGTNSLLNFIAPTVVDPIVDIAQNRDAFGRKIMPDQPAYAPPEPEHTRYWGSVAPHWRAITDTLNAISGGDGVRPGAIDVSPEVLEYMAGVAVGAAGGFVDRVVSMIEKGFTEPAEITVNDIPMARKVIGAKPTWYDKSAYYDRMRDVAEREKYAKDYRDAQDFEGLAGYAKESRAYIALEPIAKQSKRDMREVRKARSEINHAKDKGLLDSETYRERKAIVDQAEQRVVQRFNTAWNAAMLDDRQ